MTNCFHLAIPAGNIKTALKFYCDVLGCKTGNREKGKWVDIDFWGNELTLHETAPRTSKHDHPERERHAVDMGVVCIPHFGIHLPREAFDVVKARIEQNIDYLDRPYVRYEGKDTEQETFFIEDPNYNVLEIKTLVNV